MDAESALVPGYRLDRYELLCPIASGGMASVWLARLRGKRGFEKLFAIKTIKTELISDPHFQEMFLDEARIASRIIHPNVAQILELGEQGDALYIVMEYVDGDSVAKVNRLSNKRGLPLPPGVALRIVAEMCAGLHAAHQLKEGNESLGVIHRDVSPQNVLVSTSGQAKVIDFGLVKAKNRSAAETQSGVVKGKIRYMAPEQVGGRAMDHRADIWAAGMCLYELITGHTPYHNEDDLDVVKRLMSDDPLPNFHIALPPQIDKILARAIVPNPDGRFESCAAMRKAIEAAIIELGVPAENDDVAEFVQTTLPELATKRHKTIEQAIASANARRGGPLSRPSKPPTSLSAHESGDIGYAATEVSAREGASDDTALVTRKSDDNEDSSDDSDPPIVSSYGETPAGTTLREQLGEQKKRSGVGFWLAAIAVVGAAASILWPRGGGAPTMAPTATASATSAASPASSAAPTPPPPKPSADAVPVAPSASVRAGEPEAATLPDASTAGSAAAKSSTTPPQPRPRLPAAPSPPSLAVSYDGGLSPGARSAREIMIPKPDETPDEN